MARKFCPKCKRMNAGSAKTCDCGYTFASSEMVAPKPMAQMRKRCPGCGSQQPLLLEKCGCGYEFANVVELREELVSRVHVAWSYVALGAALLGVSVVISIASSGKWIVFSVGGVMLVVRGFLRRADARAALRQIDAAAGSLPPAKIVQ